MGRRSGFTLVEILLVVVIIGVMTLMAYPRVSDAMVKSNLRGARTRIVNMLSTARAAAGQGGRTKAYVKFNGNTAVITAEPRRNLPIGANTEDTLGVAVNLSTVYGATVASSPSTAQIAFDPRGIATGVAQQVTLSLTHGSYTQSVYVDILGRVTK
jgi:type II secretion system protein H